MSQMYTSVGGVLDPEPANSLRNRQDREMQLWPGCRTTVSFTVALITIATYHFVYGFQCVTILQAAAFGFIQVLCYRFPYKPL